MKKRFYIPVLAACMLIGLSFAFTSCGDDDDDNDKPNDDKKVATLMVEYDVDFSDVVYQYCDVTYSYVDASGHTVTMTTATDQDIKFTVPAAQAPGTYSIKATLAMKENFPTPDPAATYEVGHDLEIELIEYNDRGGELGKRHSESKSSLTMKGDRLVEYLTRLTQREYSVSHSYPF